MAAVIDTNDDKHAARRVLWRILPSKAKGSSRKEQTGSAKLYIDDEGVLNAKSEDLGLHMYLQMPDMKSRFEFSEP